MKQGKYFILGIISSFVLVSCNMFHEEVTLMVNKKPTTLSYNTGHTFSLDGIEVINANNGKTVSGYTTSIAPGYVFTSADAGLGKVVEVTKDKCKGTSFKIDVYNLPELKISELPKTRYRAGDLFTTEGLVVTCDNEIIEDYVTSIADGTVLTKGGYQTITITKTGYYPTSYTIVVEGALSLSVRSQPTKTIYNQGDVFNSAGLVIEDQDHNVVSDYTLSIENGSKLKYASDAITINVSKELYESTSFTIRVNELENPDIKDMAELKIYYLNDTHGSFIREDSESSSAIKEAGMAYLGKFLKEQKDADPENTLILSGGDMFQGGYESNVTHGKVMIDAMNYIGFDAMVLGNHEFDWGEEILREMVEELECPVLSCNTFYSNGEELEYIKPYTIINKGRYKVGIIGAATEGMGSSIDTEVSNNFIFPNSVSYIKDYSTELRLTYNCDIVLCGFHDEGYDDTKGETYPAKFDELTQVNNETNAKYVDAMFFAHDHRGKQGVRNGVPYVEAWSNGKDYGVVTMNMISNGVVFTVNSASANIIAAYNNCRYADSYIEAIPNKYRDIIGNPDEVIYTFDRSYTTDEFATVACKAMLWYVNNNQEQFNNHYVYVSCHNLGGIRSPVSSGDFTYRDLIKVFPFDNTLVITRCNVSNVNRMFSHSSLRAYSSEDIVYTSGYTKGVIITYIRKYSGISTSELAEFQYTAKDALVDYLTNSGVDNL